AAPETPLLSKCTAPVSCAEYCAPKVPTRLEGEACTSAAPPARPVPGWPPLPPAPSSAVTPCSAPPRSPIFTWIDTSGMGPVGPDEGLFGRCGEEAAERRQRVAQPGGGGGHAVQRAGQRRRGVGQVGHAPQPVEHV